MTPSRQGASPGSESSRTNDNTISNSGPQHDSYVKGLLQQIKLSELEISYLKQHPPAKDAIRHRKESGSERSERRVTIKDDSTTAISQEISVEQSSSNKEQAKMFRKELAEKSARLEAVMAEKSQLQNRVKVLEERGFDGKNKNLDTISRLTGKVEHLDADLKNAEERAGAVNNQLETQTILCKDREKQVHQLQEELEAKDERLVTFSHELEGAKRNLLEKERQMTELQDKFMQSSVHIMEETINGLKDENKKLHGQIKEQELEAESEKQLTNRLKQSLERVVAENAELSSTLSETRHKLDSEIRVRENRDAKLLLDTQELVVAKDKEKELKTTMSRLQTDIERERAKVKSIQEKHGRDSHLVTSLELKSNTQKSRIAELEGTMEMSRENMNNIRKQSLTLQEKISCLVKELDEKSCECQTLASKSATAENKLFEAERRVEALATLQSHRWMEFSKMADNMKELSHSMLTQSKSNTRKAAIRADLDEELEM